MIKKIFPCSSVLLIFALMAPGFADEHFPYLAEVSKGSVNVRVGPNTNFEKVDKLDQGTKVVVLGRNYEWFKVQPLATTRSYIRSDYLKIEEGGTIADVLGDNVNVRCKASSDAGSLGEVKKGSLVRVLEQKQGWCRIEPVAGTRVWIHQDFLKKISDNVPGTMMLTPLSKEAKVPVENVPVRTVVQSVFLQGTLQTIAQAPSDDVHYQIAIDERSVYYLKDIPNMSSFSNMVVTVEGTVIPDPQKKYICPLLHINKIALVL